MGTAFTPIPARPAPQRTTGALAWGRKNLFASIPNAIATLLLGAFLAWLAFHFIRWGIVHAVGKPDADLCQAARGTGACWGVIVEKGRFILMGRYPSAEHWRAVLAVLALLTPVIASCSPRCWKPWLALAWVAGIVERRPSATTTAIGKAMAIDSTVSISVSGRPPHWSVGTRDRPNTPPSISTKKAAMPATQASASQGFQQRGLQLAITGVSSASIASTARQCSALG